MKGMEKQKIEWKCFGWDGTYGGETNNGKPYTWCGQVEI